jgi:hypothetical protein
MSDLQIGVYPCQKRKIHDQGQADEYGVDYNNETPGRVPAGCLATVDEPLATIIHSIVVASKVYMSTSRGSRMWPLDDDWCHTNSVAVDRYEYRKPSPSFSSRVVALKTTWASDGQRLCRIRLRWCVGYTMMIGRLDATMRLLVICTCKLILERSIWIFDRDDTVMIFELTHEFYEGGGR